MEAIVITRSVSYKAKLSLASDKVKGYYSAIKNAFLSYKKVKSTISWGVERISFGRTNLAKIAVRGKTLVLYLNLDADNFEVNKYHQEDVSDKKAYAVLGMKIKVKSDLGLKRALELVKAIAEDNALKANAKYVATDFVAEFPAKSEDALVAEGLIKKL